MQAFDGRPRGPRGVRRVTEVLAFARDPLAYLTSTARTHGDVAGLPDLAGHGLYLVSRPDLIHDLLLSTNRTYAKGYDRDWSLRRLLGHGLITSEGAQWRHQRQRSQPTFRRAEIATFGDTMVELTDRMVDGWVDGQPRDLHADLLLLTMRITARTLFAVDLGERAPAVSDALSEALDAYSEQMTSGVWGLTGMVLGRFGHQVQPRRFRLATERIDAAVTNLIAMRAHAAPGPDLLHQLLGAHDDRAAPELHDEVQSLLLAGHETTANALSWTFVLLARHPETARRLRAEIEAVVGDRAPTVDDLDALPYTAATVTESMRLYPPAWAVSRKPLVDVEIDGRTIPAESEILMSQWVVHRDPQWFDDPDRFVPERWLDGLEDRLPKGAYFPFGGGPRTCIGNHFAMLEARLLLVRLLQRASFHIEQSTVVPQPSITLRPTGGVRVVPRLRPIPAGVRRTSRDR